MRKIIAKPMAGFEERSPGAAPQLDWLPIDRLVVDDSYQRELKPGNWNIIRKIAANFLWSRFSPVFVAPVEGGLYAIIDGQHRTHAAALCGIVQVPCQIVHMGQAEQAAAFAAVNGMVTRVTVWQVYKAALAAGEDWALKLDQVAREGGCRLMLDNASHWSKKPGQIYGVSTFRRLVEKYPANVLPPVLALILKTEGLGTEVECWDMGILAPLVAALVQRPHLLTMLNAHKRLEDFDLFALGETITARNRERIRRGLPYVKKSDQMESRIVEWLDSHLPHRVSARP